MHSLFQADVVSCAPQQWPVLCKFKGLLLGKPKLSELCSLGWWQVGYLLLSLFGPEIIVGLPVLLDSRPVQRVLNLRAQLATGSGRRVNELCVWPAIHVDEFDGLSAIVAEQLLK